jgi:glycosyltransferase involved in cell wall biosynthesis
MKILHVSPLYYPSIGGNQYHVQLMAEKLAQLGNEVHVFTSRALHPRHFRTPDTNINDLPLEEVINGVHVRRFRINYRFMDLVLQRNIRIRGAYRLFRALTGNTFELWEHGPVVLGMLNAIRRLKPEVILAANNYSFTTYLCYLAKKFFKIPLVLMPITHPADPWTNHPSLKIMYDAADLLVACTDFEKKHLLRLGQSENKIAVLPLGVDPDIFPGAAGEKARRKYHFKDGPIVAYFGRKVLHKGIETLIDCMGLVWRECPGARLLLAGQADDHFAARMQKGIDQYSTTEKQRIIDISDFAEEDKGDLYEAVDIVAMPSNVDCFGIVYLEAWANGKPVIACKNTPQETIVRDGVDGLLVEYQNKEQLADAILKLFKDEELKKRMGRAGREILRSKYHVDVYGANLQEAYRKLLERLKR